MDVMAESFEFFQEHGGGLAVSERSDGNRVERFERQGPITQQPPDSMLIRRTSDGPVEDYTMQRAAPAGSSCASGGGPDGGTMTGGVGSGATGSSQQRTRHIFVLTPFHESSRPLDSCLVSVSAWKKWLTPLSTCKALRRSSRSH